MHELAAVIIARLAILMEYDSSPNCHEDGWDIDVTNKKGEKFRISIRKENSDEQ